MKYIIITFMDLGAFGYIFLVLLGIIFILIGVPVIYLELALGYFLKNNIGLAILMILIMKFLGIVLAYIVS